MQVSGSLVAGLVTAPPPPPPTSYTYSWPHTLLAALVCWALGFNIKPDIIASL